MNRRSFLKSAALSAVAVPVVGLPAPMPVAKAVPLLPANHVWLMTFRHMTSTGRGKAVVRSTVDMLDWTSRWLAMGYSVSAKTVPLTEADDYLFLPY